jgi:hypothetical protein
VGPVDSGDFAKQSSVIFVDDHHAILPGDKQTVIGWIGHNVIPGARAANFNVVDYFIGRWRSQGGSCQKNRE